MVWRYTASRRAVPRVRRGLIGEAGLSAENRPAHKSRAYQRWLDEVMLSCGGFQVLLGPLERLLVVE